MSRIRGLELLFNLERKNIKSREDCIVAVFHCLLINDGLQCVGTGDEWPNPSSWTSTELLPQGWNNNQDLYSLRYATKDSKSRFLFKIVKSDHMLLVNAAKNEDAVASVDIPTADYVSDNYSDYSSAFKDLERLAELFSKEIMGKLKEAVKPQSKQAFIVGSSHVNPRPPHRPEPGLGIGRDIPHPHFPQIGGSDLDPFGGGGGGMLMDPSSFGIPARPSLPEFGIGGPGGLPRGAVPPGARFDPIRPPIYPSRNSRPNPGLFYPPDDDYII